MSLKIAELNEIAVSFLLYISVTSLKMVEFHKP